MSRRTRIKLKVLALCCTVIAVVATAIPLFHGTSDAQLLIALLGAFGAGATLRSLVRDRGDLQGR